MMKRFAAVGLVCFLLAALCAPAAQGQTFSGGLASFSAKSDAYGMSTSVKVLRLLPLPVEVFVPRSRAQIDSQPRAIGFAAPVDIPIGELLGLLGIPVTPPTFCYSYFPTTPESPADNQCGLVPFDPTGDDQSVRVLTGAGSTHSRGDADDPERVSVKSQAAANFVQTPAVSVGTVSTKTTAEIVAGVSTSRAEVAIESIDIAGIVQIDSIKSAAVARANGTPDVAPPEADFTIGGMSIAGVPVRLTSEGLAVGQVPSLPLIPIVGIGVPIPDTSTDLPLPLATVLKPIVDALNGAGITFGFVEPPVETIDEGGTSATASVRGLVVGFEDPATGDFAEFRFGAASATATATTDEAFADADADSGAAPPSTEFGADVASGTMSGDPGLDLPAPGGASDAAGELPAPAPGAGGSSAGEQQPTDNSGLPAGTTATISPIAGRFRGIYTAGALATLVLLGGASLPSRRRAWSAVLSTEVDQA